MHANGFTPACFSSSASGMNECALGRRAALWIASASFLPVAFAEIRYRLDRSSTSLSTSGSSRRAALAIPGSAAAVNRSGLVPSRVPAMPRARTSSVHAGPHSASARLFAFSHSASPARRASTIVRRVCAITDLGLRRTRAAIAALPASCRSANQASSTSSRLSLIRRIRAAVNSSSLRRSSRLNSAGGVRAPHCRRIPFPPCFGFARRF